MNENISKINPNLTRDQQILANSAFSQKNREGRIENLKSQQEEANKKSEDIKSVSGLISGNPADVIFELVPKKFEMEEMMLALHDSRDIIGFAFTGMKNVNFMCGVKAFFMLSKFKQMGFSVDISTEYDPLRVRISKNMR